MKKYFAAESGWGAPQTKALDSIFPIDGAREAFAEIERIYEAECARDRCALVIGNGGHLNYADLIRDKPGKMWI
ncbi:MAG: hypothetical protein IJ428_02255 [Clostridia bacterium]|nr:hypothetical protein [Clostridia bacterium]